MNRPFVLFLPINTATSSSTPVTVIATFSDTNPLVLPVRLSSTAWGIAPITTLERFVVYCSCWLIILGCSPWRCPWGGIQCSSCYADQQTDRRTERGSFFDHFGPASTYILFWTLSSGTLVHLNSGMISRYSSYTWIHIWIHRSWNVTYEFMTMKSYMNS